MIRQSEYLHRGELTAVILHMADKEIIFSNEDLGYFTLDKVEDSYTKEFSAFKEEKKAGEVVMVISPKCVGEIEWILSHHHSCAIYAMTVGYEDQCGNNFFRKYDLFDAWKTEHRLRVTSMGQLMVFIGAKDWEFSNSYESLPDWWFEFMGEVSNKGAVLYTEDTPIELRQSHYQVYSDSMFELTQLIEDVKECFKVKTKAKVIMILSIFDLYSMHHGRTYNIDKYTYLDTDGTPRNLRIENGWKNCSKEYTRVPPTEMRKLATKLKNKTLSQLMSIHGDTTCAEMLDECDVDEIFDSL